MIKPKRPVRIAFINSKGGTGKTRTAVTLATYWARRMGEVHLVDVDPQETGSASYWLDRTNDDLETLFWTSTTSDELLEVIGDVPRPVIIDTRPMITAEDVQTVAELVDLIVIPGDVDEIDSIVETHRRIQAPTKRVVIVTKTSAQVLNASTGAGSIAALEQIGLPVVGAVRTNRELARGAIMRLRPDQIASKSQIRLRQDMEQIIAGLREHIELPKEVLPNA